MRRKSLACSSWATSNSSRSASSASWRGSPSRSRTHSWIRWPAPSRRRSSEFSCTMRAWWAALPTAATLAASSET